MSGHSSSSTFHHFIILSYYNYQKIRNSEIQKFKKWTLKVSQISKFMRFRIIRKIFFHFSQGRSLIFLDLIQVFWSNKMKKYGPPRPNSWNVDKSTHSCWRSPKKNWILSLMPYFFRLLGLSGFLRYDF